MGSRMASLALFTVTGQFGADGPGTLTAMFEFTGLTTNGPGI